MKQPAYLAATSNLLEDELDHCRGLASAWGTVYESHILAGQGLIHCLHLFTGSGSVPTACASVLLLCTPLAEHRMGVAAWLSGRDGGKCMKACCLLQCPPRTRHNWVHCVHAFHAF